MVSAPPRRPMAIIAWRASAPDQVPSLSGPDATASTPSRKAMTTPVARLSTPSRTASVVSVRIRAVRSGSTPFRESANAARTSSRVRTLMTACTASAAWPSKADSLSAVSTRRRRRLRTSECRAAGSRAVNSLASSSQAIDSGRSARRSVVHLAPDRTWHRDRAAARESRSIAKYQWDPPTRSDSSLKESRPLSGSGPRPSQLIMTGRSWRWISARRLTPSVRAWMWRRAPSGSR